MKQTLINTAKKLEKMLNLENTTKKLKKALNVRPYPVIGLDVGSSAVKMVGLGKNGDGYRVTAAAMSTIDSVDGGNDPSQRAIIAAIKKCLQSSGGSISRNCHFVLGLSGPKVKVSSFNFASLTLDEVAQAVMFEAEQVCPFDIRTGVVDYQLFGLDDADAGGFRKKKKIYPNVKGVLAVATKEVISRKRKLAEEALLKCVLMDSEGLALLNCLKEYLLGDEKLPVAVINVGMSLTTVAILGTDGLPFIRDLKYCGSDIIDNIAKSSGVSAGQVSREISEGTENSDYSADIAPACRELIRDINETVAYYSVHHGSDAIKHVYVCGGFSLLDAFVEVLVDSIDSDVSVWNPFLRMNCDDNIAGSELVGKCGPALAAAAGLAMRQV